MRRPETAYHLRRITIDGILPCLIFEEFRHCKNLCMYVDVTEYGKNAGKWICPPIMGPNLTYLEVSNIKCYPQSQSWKDMLEVLPQCRSLRALRLTRVIESYTDCPPIDCPPTDCPPGGRLCTLLQLELLELTRRVDYYAWSLLFTQWLPSLVLPKLNTLLLNAGDLSGPALLAFKPTICTLRINSYPPPITPMKNSYFPNFVDLLCPIALLTACAGSGSRP